MEVHERLRLLRQRLGLSTRAFGGGIHLSGSAVTNMEKGLRSVTPRTASDICRRYHVRPEWLLEGQGEMLADPTEVVAGLTKGEIDIAALPTNLASTLYHKTEGGIQLLSLCAYGVLYVLENGETIRSMKDLEGKTVHAYGQGANPEFVLNYLLGQNEVDAAQVDVQWHASTDEVVALMASGEATVCMLPVPAATTVLIQNDKVRTALDLTEEWKDAEAEGVLTMSCVVAQSEFVKNNPEAVDAFLKELEASITFMADEANREEAARLAEAHGIIPKAAVAKRALPDANLCFVTGEDMVSGIQGYYGVLFAADPASIGGSIPDSGFYYLSGK